ncbi:hypothetical protein LCGC14_2556800 [marine sediment metagenome]|uniref:Calcineurin-like phosphoesterase domain-containing protein n=1 Tax=marine sediment metagenome TaxID=412755 RepID=A0A0F9CXI6_9ZZZZ
MLRLNTFVGLTVALVGLPARAERAEKPNLLAKVSWQYSVDEGTIWSDEVPPLGKKGTTTVDVRGRFDIPAATTGEYLALATGLRHGQTGSYRLNGQPVPQPLGDMIYRLIPGIPAGLLRRGANVLEAKVAYEVGMAGGRPLSVPTALRFQRDADLKIQSGPVLGAFGRDFFTVTCRTNMPAAVELRVTQIVDSHKRVGQTAVLAKSPKGIFHRFRVKPPGTIAAHTGYALVARSGERTVSESLSAPSLPTKGLRFVVAGDNRGYPRTWARVAGAIGKHRPHFVVHTGDMLNSGRRDYQWDQQFFHPARRLLAAGSASSDSARKTSICL